MMAEGGLSSFGVSVLYVVVERRGFVIVVAGADAGARLGCGASEGIGAITVKSLAG